jgi:tRNA-specific 2-thiouridylase
MPPDCTLDALTPAAPSPEPLPGLLAPDAATHAPIAVAMSGGVDSSTVAAMLRAEGRPIIGLTLQLWNQRRLAGRTTSGGQAMPEAVQGRCCSIDDVYDARRVAGQLGIPYYLVNAQQRFEEEVVRPFVDEYLAGRTPIPCTLCNNHLKFDQLLLTARQIGAERIATGHYARNRYEETTGRWILSRPADRSKDQTYFLFGLTQEQLSRTLFPLGEMEKPAVRALAADQGLELAQKPDSQEICFIPGGSYSQFLEAYLDEQQRAMPDSSGDIVNESGEVVGVHAGIHAFTVGQRKGLGVSSADPLYVLKIHPDSHRVEVGAGEALLSRSLRANRLNWIAIDAPPDPIRVSIKIRHRHEPAWATLRVTAGDTIEATFDDPQRAITPGQSAVFYNGDDVVGGGWIF